MTLKGISKWLLTVHKVPSNTHKKTRPLGDYFCNFACIEQKSLRENQNTCIVVDLPSSAEGQAVFLPSAGSFSQFLRPIRGSYFCAVLAAKKNPVFLSTKKMIKNTDLHLPNRVSAQALLWFSAPRARLFLPMNSRGYWLTLRMQTEAHKN